MCGEGELLGNFSEKECQRGCPGDFPERIYPGGLFGELSAVGNVTVRPPRGRTVRISVHDYNSLYVANSGCDLCQHC